MKSPPVKSSAKKMPAKKAANISLSMDMYLEAKNLGIDISHLCELKLRQEIQARKKQQWNEEHATFLAAYSTMVEAEGVALEEWRAF